MMDSRKSPSVSSYIRISQGIRKHITNPFFLSQEDGNANLTGVSKKVFIGGLPPDITEDEIMEVFNKYGELIVDWPNKKDQKSDIPPKGYAFIIFQEDNSVYKLLNACNVRDDKYYHGISSRSMKHKYVQIRPWKLSDIDFKNCPDKDLDPRKTVFIGGLPRPVTAFQLAMIMNRVYGNVIYSGIDVDQVLKYPKGAGRVTFATKESYIAALASRFIQLQNIDDFDKMVEIKPYVLDDQLCDGSNANIFCRNAGNYFCSNNICLKYYCKFCWAYEHESGEKKFHKPCFKKATKENE